MNAVELAAPKKHTAKTILLLGPRGAGKTTALLSLIYRPSEPSPIQSYFSQMTPAPQTFQFCAQQTLLLDHLTIRENISLIAALHGVSEARVDKLLSSGDFDKGNGETQVGDLTPLQRCTLSLLNALIPEPTWLLIDDLAAGLSTSAKKILWQTLRQTDRFGVEGIVYATRDLEAVSMLNPNEVWLLENGEVVQDWSAANLPAVLKTSVAFSFEFRNHKAAENYFDKISATFGKFDVLTVERPARKPQTVRVFTKTDGKIVDLILAAGLQLLRFHSLPLEIGELPDGWRQTEPALLETTNSSENGQLPPSLSPEKKITGRQRWRVVVELGLNEWRRYFRRFWKGLNVLLSNLLPLGLLASLLQVDSSSSTDFFLLAAITLTASAMTGLVWGIEAAAQLVRPSVTTNENLARSPVNHQEALTPLAFYDLTPAGRGSALSGLLLGQAAILLAQASVLLCLWPVIWQEWRFTALSWFLWLALALVALVLSLLFGRLALRPFSNYGLGLLLYLIALGSVVALARIPDVWLTVTWFWPVTGLVNFYRAMLAPGETQLVVLLPFLISFSMLGILGYAAVRTLYRSPGKHGVTK